MKFQSIWPLPLPRREEGDLVVAAAETRVTVGSRCYHAVPKRRRKRPPPDLQPPAMEDEEPVGAGGAHGQDTHVACCGGAHRGVDRERGWGYVYQVDRPRRGSRGLRDGPAQEVNTVYWTKSNPVYTTLRESWITGAKNPSPILSLYPVYLDSLQYQSSYLPSL
ncbi:hypothetical protein BRADI_2g10723v3 [Brachypodium distachyon]|uniref:Uncharacterized protein n=1 Tax=Brachypodium distachyon TaxID=15368 RepID=A0A2K2D7U1_BRADI|nr:hypothetical protein BRADI_2g10723v3 [Brachypodium distachyon]